METGEALLTGFITVMAIPICLQTKVSNDTIANGSRRIRLFSEQEQEDRSLRRFARRVTFGDGSCRPLTYERTTYTRL